MSAAAKKKAAAAEGGSAKKGKRVSVKTAKGMLNAMGMSASDWDSVPRRFKALWNMPRRKAIKSDKAPTPKQLKVRNCMKSESKKLPKGTVDRAKKLGEALKECIEK
ncbi:MAG: hypothetical protein M0R66_03935 [Candidatus Omnitrophica bacterium]|nr:hypothetical protein [Candidatus Omnitrophota bacterium]